jgi:hypothetical protein
MSEGYLEQDMNNGKGDRKEDEIKSVGFHAWRVTLISTLDVLSDTSILEIQLDQSDTKVPFNL